MNTLLSVACWLIPHEHHSPLHACLWGGNTFFFVGSFFPSLFPVLTYWFAACQRLVLDCKMDSTTLPIAFQDLQSCLLCQSDLVWWSNRSDVFVSCCVLCCGLARYGIFTVVNMEAARYSKTLVFFCNTTWWHNSEDLDFCGLALLQQPTVLLHWSSSFTLYCGLQNILAC